MLLGKYFAKSIESTENRIDGISKENKEKLDISLKKYDAIMGDNEIEKSKVFAENAEINLDKYNSIMDEIKGYEIEDYNRRSKNWPPEIVENISSIDEYKVYENANLSVEKVDGRDCLVKNDIDWTKKDFMGRSNKERVEQGLSPIGSNERPIELHHIGQHSDSPFAELTMEEHRGKGNDTVLHNKLKETEIDRQEFSIQRNEHWLNRVKGMEQ